MGKLESTEALSVPFPSASGNCEPRWGTKGGCPLLFCVTLRECVSHMFGKVDSMLHSTDERSVCCRTKLSQTVLWRHRPAGGSGHLKLINFPRRACIQTVGIVGWKLSRTDGVSALGGVTRFCWMI
ncbi:hypothetical protein K0M31_001248 [Melipona bicolor]|uniref:Uncharacterized protein n=1 Tax=Melipona bicolor TaxID=60889 RepID=A0AA40GF77_9HYME|nr:hypothetical protein K0M31_001248 [Melipona bicolor]